MSCEDRVYESDVQTTSQLCPECPQILSPFIDRIGYRFNLTSRPPFLSHECCDIDLQDGTSQLSRIDWEWFLRECGSSRLNLPQLNEHRALFFVPLKQGLARL